MSTWYPRICERVYNSTPNNLANHLFLPDTESDIFSCKNG